MLLLLVKGLLLDHSQKSSFSFILIIISVFLQQLTFFKSNCLFVITLLYNKYHSKAALQIKQSQKGGCEM